MANGLYELGRKKFLDADIDWLVDNIKVVLVDTATYAVDLVNDEFLSDIPAGERVATSGNFASKNSDAGIADAANITFSTVSGDICEAIVIYQDTGNPATSPLIVYIDTASGLPVTPVGTDITITWDSGADKIFNL